MATSNTLTEIDAEIQLMSLIAKHLDGFGPQNRYKVAEMLSELAGPLAGANDEQVTRAMSWALARASADAAKAARKPEEADGSATAEKPKA